MNNIYKTLVEIRRKCLALSTVMYLKRNKDPEVLEIIKNIKENGLNIFNYEFTKKYDHILLDIKSDNDNGLLYIVYGGNRIYFKRGMSKDDIYEYWKGICIEQDEESPHKYLSDMVDLSNDEIVFDCGGAEGNFIFLNRSRIKKAVIVECDLGWIEALEATFKDDKNILIEKSMVGELSEGNTISIDDLCKKYGIPTCVKMDIEGAEVGALRGAREALKKDIKWLVCTYHRQTDYDDIVKLFDQSRYEIETSKGYMTIYWTFSYKKPYIRRGLIRVKKKGA